MKCPKCEGKGTRDIYDTGVLVGENIPCPHCDGSGEMGDGDVWLCKIWTFDLKLHNKEVLRYCMAGWKYGLHDIDGERVEPIARMKEVE